MALLIDFKSGDKLIINGAVLENAGANSKILLHNMASVLREKELLTEEEAQTPATRIYFALQNAYIFAEHRGDHLAQFSELLQDYLKACPSANDIAEKIQKVLKDGNYYRALKETRGLVLHEMTLLQDLESQVQRWAEETEGMGDQPGGDEVQADPAAPAADDDA